MSTIALMIFRTAENGDVYITASGFVFFVCMAILAAVLS